MQSGRDSKAAILESLLEVKDPELPTISVVDLGIIRNVEVGQQKVIVTITPTYSGCPALDVIREDIRAALAKVSSKTVEVETKLSPPWTTDWLTDNARQELIKLAIAAPEKKPSHPSLKILDEFEPVPCPRCNEIATKLISEFSSTACKALLFCPKCQEPFEYFKQH